MIILVSSIAMLAATTDFYLGGTTFADMLIINMMGMICAQLCKKQGE